MSAVLTLWLLLSNTNSQQPSSKKIIHLNHLSLQSLANHTELQIYAQLVVKNDANTNGHKHK